MSDGTKIEWTDATWNVVNGCSVISPGCTNCYAMRLAGTRLQHHPSRAGLTIDSKAGPVWTGEFRFNEKVLLDPLRWRRARRIFVCAHGDLFHEKVPDEWIDRVFAVMALAPQHTFQVLSKRPQRMRDYLNDRYFTESGSDALSEEIDCVAGVRGLSIDVADLGQKADPTDWSPPLPNVWLGTSVEDQKRADERIPILLDTPAAVRWISAEPLLGPVDLDRVYNVAALKGVIFCADWVVAGGESGPGARPMHPDWARSLRDQCAAAGVAFLFKQWGNYRPCTDAELKQACGATLVGDRITGAYMMPEAKKQAGRLLDDVQHDGYPEVTAA